MQYALLINIYFQYSDTIFTVIASRFGVAIYFNYTVDCHATLAMTETVVARNDGI